MQLHPYTPPASPCVHRRRLRGLRGSDALPRTKLLATLWTHGRFSAHEPSRALEEGWCAFVQGAGSAPKRPRLESEEPADEAWPSQDTSEGRVLVGAAPEGDSTLGTLSPVLRAVPLWPLRRAPQGARADFEALLGRRVKDEELDDLLGFYRDNRAYLEEAADEVSLRGACTLPRVP